MVGQGGPRQTVARGQADVPQAFGEVAPAHGPGKERAESERCTAFGGHAQIPGHQLHAAGNQGRHSHTAPDPSQNHRGHLRLYHRSAQGLHQGNSIYTFTFTTDYHRV